MSSSYDKRITYFGAIRSLSSWAKVAREICLCLAKSGNLAGIYERKGFLYDRAMPLDELEPFISKNFVSDIVFTFEHPKNYIYLPKSTKKIGFLVYEFTALPKIWVENINTFLDMVFVPSLFVYKTFVSSGVKKDKIKILRYGFNPQYYYPQNTAKKDSFFFLCVGSAQKREGIDLLLAAFKNAFDNRSNVNLVIKLSYSNMRPKPFEIRNFKAVIDDYKRELGDRLLIIDSALSEKEMGYLYRSCDAYVSFTKAEAFGLCFVEALACGKPCVAINYSGQKDFLNRENSYFILHKLEVAKNEEYEISNIRQFSAAVVLDSAVRVLREVASAGKSLKKGFFLEGSSYYHWDKITEEFLSYL